jgi:hypothetical protein
MDHCHPREKPMRSFSRIAVMVVVSLLTLTICGGGYTDKNAFAFVGLLLVMFWGLPLVGLLALFHLLDWRFGSYARYPIALIGLFPLFLIIYFRGQGDAIYMRAIVLSGLTWSAAWLATSHIFSRVPRNEITSDTDPLLEEPSPMEKHNPRSERSTRPDIF